MHALLTTSIKIGDIFRQYGQQYRQNYKMSDVQQQAFFAIKNCRTSMMGGHTDRCDQCGHQRIFYNSCRNRHCPQCQGLKQAKWVDKLACDLLPVQYFHIVFTIPSEMNHLALQNPTCMYDILFKSASETLITLSKERKYLCCLTGIVAVLHSWGQNLMYHPHLHTMVPAGGWNEQEQKWRASRKKLFIPVKVISTLFKNKFLFYLKKAYADQELKFCGEINQLNLRCNFKNLINSLYEKEWVVYIKKPFKNSAQIVEYLGRYSHRVAIANSRIKSVEGDHVTFSMKDYRDGCRKIIKLTPTEFIRRLLLHILPKRFCKIRYYGLFATRNRSTTLARCRKNMCKSIRISRFTGLTWQEQLRLITGKDITICPVCQKGKMFCWGTFTSAGSLS
jgi:uncharacterized protein (DUF983 family)